MKKIITMTLMAGLLFTACEAEVITMVETTTTHATATPSSGSGSGVSGGSSCDITIDGVVFDYASLNIVNDSDMDVLLWVTAVSEDGEEAVQFTLPLTTLEVGDHLLTYTPSAGYAFTSGYEDDFYKPTNEADNILTITDFDLSDRFVHGTFSTKMRNETGDSFLDNVSGSFVVNY